MNTHLNLFRTYTKVNREDYQLEDDLTRGLALTLLENNLFLYSFLRNIFKDQEEIYKNVFSDFEGKNEISIDIQKKVSTVECDHLFAVSISEAKLDIPNFFKQQHHREYDPITDMLITVANIAIIVEVKPNYHDCTAQLYNQAYNANNKAISPSNVTPIDYNWAKLMETAIEVNNFQAATNKPSRFLQDFINYIKSHNYTWLPELSLGSLDINGNVSAIRDRLKTAIEVSNLTALEAKRLAIKVNDISWTDELILDVNQQKQSMLALSYPGNTKGQGYSLYQKDNEEPNFKKEIVVDGITCKVHKSYHIKLSGFQTYFTGLWFNQSDIKNKNFFTRVNFLQYSGRKKRGDGWLQIENFFDEYFKEDYHWRKKIEWEQKVLDSGRSQFDIALGYECYVEVEYSELQKLDKDKSNVEPLANFLQNLKAEFGNLLVS